MKKILILLCSIVFLASAVAVAYPMIANTIAEQNQSEIRTEYNAMIEQADTSQLDEIRAAAKRYNNALADSGAPAEDLDLLNQYDTLLDPIGNGMMGRIVIPSIDVDQPIYHGRDESMLQIGAAHVYATSLPVGGENTHTVISGHTGMAGNKMFTDLELLQIGDLFYLDVLAERLTYEVDQIVIVLPNETDELHIVTGKDYATLMTCTPYGINSHRLLVRGHRIETAADESTEETTAAVETKKSKWESEYENGLLIGAAAAFGVVVLMLTAVWIYRRKRKCKKAQE